MILERLKEFMDYKGITIAAFERSIGMSNASFGKSLKNGKAIGTDKLENILSIYKDINPDWLLTGKGSMLRSGEKPEEIPSVNQSYKGAPYFNVDFLGGFDLMENEQTRTPDYYIDYKPYNKEGVVWCNLTGHSMEPELSNGDVIALKEVNTPIQYLPAGEIYGIVTDDYRTVKRVRLSHKEGFVRLIPSNKSEEYCEQEIPISMIRKVYAVLGSIRKFF
ncbi:S24 family peptidase [Bacteroides caecigallinarum]|uniref:S24 family peptidase n=1 Tax=Bacteroides caecigallinarum TaxID=1411144 RepID=UPI001F3564C2|nr:S24 family peptidase [Bacteroides caecigallinarum]MCF2738428.1 helix-turn-helix transcriptional regulator [Bacteroides caecigallinarum]